MADFQSQRGCACKVSPLSSSFPYSLTPAQHYYLLLHGTQECSHRQSGREEMEGVKRKQKEVTVGKKSIASGGPTKIT